MCKATPTESKPNRNVNGGKLAAISHEQHQGWGNYELVVRLRWIKGEVCFRNPAHWKNKGKDIIFFLGRVGGNSRN